MYTGTYCIWMKNVTVSTFIHLRLHTEYSLVDGLVTADALVDRLLASPAFGERMATVEFQDGSNGVSVRVTFDSEPTHSEEQQRTGWQAILESFARHVQCKVASQ